MRVLLMVLICAALSTPSTLLAQRADTVGVRARADTMIGPRRNAGATRLFGSVGGSLLGLVAGAYIGSQLPAHDCGCDDPGLDELIYGGLAGITLGAALGAAAPDLRSVCSFKTRVGRSLIGSTLFAVGAFVISGVRDEAILIAVPAGAVGGSLAALGRCWKSYL